MKGLIFKEKWADLILSGQKTMDIRGQNTKKVERIGIIKSGTKKVFGEVDLTGSTPLTKELFESTRDKHHWDASYEELLKVYKKPHAWMLKEASLYEEPKSYNHKHGTVIWSEI